MVFSNVLRALPRHGISSRMHGRLAPLFPAQVLFSRRAASGVESFLFFTLASLCSVEKFKNRVREKREKR
jgi:hypothetical protein